MNNQIRTMLDEVQLEYRKLMLAKRSGQYTGDVLAELNKRIEHAAERTFEYQVIFDAQQLEIAVSAENETVDDELNDIFNEIMEERDPLMRDIPEDF